MSLTVQHVSKSSNPSQAQRLWGQVEHGVYTEDPEQELDDAAVEAIERHLGCEGQTIQRPGWQTGAGWTGEEAESDGSDNGMDVDDEHDKDYEDIDDDDMEARIASTQAHNFHHEAVEAPKHRNPLKPLGLEDVFVQALQRFQDDDIIPSGYGLDADEWGPDGYPVEEIIPVGRKGTKSLQVTLPVNIWKPRAELWVQALHIMNSLIDDETS